MKHEDDIEFRIEKLEQTLKDAFPDGDARCHRLFHEALNEHKKWLHKLKRDIIAKTIYAVLAIGATWVGIAIWMAFKAEVMK
jgi:hypothetical protein|tara:strand:+ start:31 stop:276 length:246 start_codon:yes stop_codon:yes gene_type:complete